MLFAGLATAVAAALPLVAPPPTPSPESSWDAFCRTLRTLQELFRREPDFTQYAPLMLQLGLSDNMAWALGRGLLVADGDGKTAAPNPLPPPWDEKVGDTVFACRGRVFPEDGENFVLGLGWFGPMGGALMVYGGGGVKRIEVETGQILGVQLRDLTGDGLDEVIVWHDNHHGSGEWQRFVDVYSAVSPPPAIENLGSPSSLQRVWSGQLWHEFAGHADKFEVTFDREGITIQRQPPTGGSPRRFTWNRECRRFQ